MRAPFRRTQGTPPNMPRHAPTIGNCCGGGSGSRVTHLDDTPAHHNAWALVSLCAVGKTSVLPFDTPHLPEHPSAPTLTSHLARKRLPPACTRRVQDSAEVLHISFPGGWDCVEPAARSRAVRKGRGKRLFHQPRAFCAQRKSLRPAAVARARMLETPEKARESPCLGLDVSRSQPRTERRWPRAGFPACRFLLKIGPFCTREELAACEKSACAAYIP